MIMNDVMGCTAGVATGSDHPDYPGHCNWVTFCLGQSGFHPDILICLTRIKLNCLVIVRIKNCSKKVDSLFNRAVTNISRMLF